MKHRIESLTGIRFLAAFIVFFGHLIGHSYIFVHSLGPVSVQLFFVLSGFVIYLSYREKIFFREISFANFMLLRVFRLYPIFLITICFSTIFIIFTGNINSLLKHFLIDVTLTRSWWGSLYIAFTPINGPSWSVSTEIMFYIICFYLLMCLSKKWLIYSFLFFYIVWFFVLFTINGKVSNEQYQWLYYINPYFRFCDFWAGCICAIIFLKYSDCISKLLAHNIFIASLLEIISITLLFGSQYFLPMYKYYWVIFFLTIFCGLTLIIFAFNVGMLSKLFSTWWMVLLGESSYSLYLIHVPVFDILNFTFNMHRISSVIEKIILIACPILLSVIFYKYIEVSFNRYLRKKFIE